MENIGAGANWPLKFMSEARYGVGNLKNTSLLLGTSPSEITPNKSKPSSQSTAARWD